MIKDIIFLYYYAESTFTLDVQWTDSLQQWKHPGLTEGTEYVCWTVNIYELLWLLQIGKSRHVYISYIGKIS